MKKFLLGLAVFALAFAILSISVLRSASPRYAFSTPAPTVLSEGNKISVDYNLPYPGRILPDSPLWPLKAFRDKLWHFVTINDSKEAELSLLCSDKRLGMAKILFEKGKPELAFSTLTKGEKYFEQAFLHEEMAREKGENTTEVLNKIALSALKHRQVIDEILAIAPEDAKPGIIKIQNYSKDVYVKAAAALKSKGEPAPINPFDWEN